MSIMLAQARDGVVTMLDGATGTVRWQVARTPDSPVPGTMRCVGDGDRVFARATPAYVFVDTRPHDVT